MVDKVTQTSDCVNYRQSQLFIAGRGQHVLKKTGTARCFPPGSGKNLSGGYTSYSRSYRDQRKMRPKADRPCFRS